MELRFWRFFNCAVVVGLLACHESSNHESGESVPWQRWAALVEVGRSFSDPDDYIGTIASTAVLSDSMIAVLDPTNFRIWILDDKGKKVAAGGRNGRGPGEYVDPVLVLPVSDDSIIVIDRTLRRIDLLTVLNQGLHHVGTSEFQFYLTAACAMGNSLFVLGSSGYISITRISRFDLSNTELSVRHPVYQLPFPDGKASGDTALRSIILGNGFLACVPEEEILVNATEDSGMIYGIAMDGTLRWATRLPEFSSFVHRISPGVGISRGVDRGIGYGDYVISASYIGDGLVQVISRRRFLRDSGLTAELTGFVIRASDGAVVGQASSPPHFGASSGSIVVEHLEEPTPHVRIWKRR